MATGKGRDRDGHPAPSRKVARGVFGDVVGKSLGEGATRGASPELLERNVTKLVASSRRDHLRQSWQVRLADTVTGFTGSIGFVGLHIVWFGVWVLVNTGLAGSTPFDPFPFSLLTMIVSLESIFLSAIVLISQNRMQELSDRRSELDLHVNLLAERENTELLRKLARIEDALGIQVPPEEEAADRALMKETPSVETLEDTQGRDTGERDAASAVAGER